MDKAFEGIEKALIVSLYSMSELAGMLSRLSGKKIHLKKKIMSLA
ncbi:hypothetical protein PZB74_21915 [Porifericola rhodea]|nr:hypothetical protein [Porifericola rhodea]WKN31605.1 hypothetical protein PZB74_21915 [Porifericola rhodea]